MWPGWHAAASSAAVALPVMESGVWRAAAAAHRGRMLELVSGTLDHDKRHPIYNFLFFYYGLDKHLLLRWSPGLGQQLTGVDPNEPTLWQGSGWRSVAGGCGCMDPSLITSKQRASLELTTALLRRTATRPPQLQCYGLHEWAMVYAPPGAPEARFGKFQQMPMRLSQAEVNAVVEGSAITCTHQDAFRFFTPEARPLNTVQPDRSVESQLAFAQPGCVHANMDLFKHAMALFPFLPAELVADTFELAISARVLDMRASPYDLSAAADLLAGGEHIFGELNPVRIESAEGRKEYQRLQSAIAHHAVPLRARLLECYDAVLDCA